MIVEVVPVWDAGEGRIEYFVVRVLRARGFIARQVFVDNKRLEDPYDVELFEAVRVRAAGESEDGTFDEVDIVTPQYYSMRLGER